MKARGFTILEIMVAFAVFTIAAIPLLTLQSTSAKVVFHGQKRSAIVSALEAVVFPYENKTAQELRAQGLDPVTVQTDWGQATVSFTDRGSFIEIRAELKYRGVRYEVISASLPEI